MLVLTVLLPMLSSGYRGENIVSSSPSSSPMRMSSVSSRRGGEFNERTTYDALEPTTAILANEESPYPSGPYISPDRANELVVIPDPEEPSLKATARIHCPHEDTDLLDWQSTSTWGGSPPSTGDNVILPENVRIIVRQSIPKIFGIISIPQSSELIFGAEINNNTAERSITFDVHGINVEGKLTIGSDTCRMETSVTITLHGNRPQDAVSNVRHPTYKGISVTGTISLHGERFYRTWTRLAKTVEPGDSVIMLQHKVNWKPDQEIILVTTSMKDSREWHRNEVSIVQSIVENPVTGVGTAVILKNPASYQHLAHSGYQGEVGLLSRRITIQGSNDSEPTDPDPHTCLADRSIFGDKGQPCPNTELTGFGGHIIVHNGGKGYVEGVELFRMGQTNVIGRYPMHFHLLGNSCSDCYFRDSSVHRSFYRCVSIHGTNFLDVSENVAFDVTGFCYYLEDGVEHDNRIEFNLGAHIHTLGPKIPYGPGQKITPFSQNENLAMPADVSASAFYITNVKNYIIGNAASGGWSGFAFPLLAEPVGLHRGTRLRPSSELSLIIDGNTAHSSSWWWKHSAPFYFGGTLYYNDDDVLEYNAGRDLTRPKRAPCVINKCKTIDGCAEYSWCQPFHQAWLKVTNTKAFLAAGVGLNSWNGRMELINYECHDCGLSLESLSTDGFWADNMLGVCRSKVPLVLPGNAKAWHIPGDGFKWYDTNQEHILTNITLRNCGYRSAEFDQYNQDPERGCGDEDSTGCHEKSSVWSFVAHSDQFVPEIMQATKYISIENSGRYFRFHDFRKNAPSSVSGREQNWFDADGSMTGLGVPSVISSGLADAGMWWFADEKAIYDPQGPLWFFEMTNGRGLGHVRIKWDDALHDEVGVTQCGNGKKIPCDYVGYIKHIGDLYAEDHGLPVTANADIVGPVGGFGWKFELNRGAPKSMRFEEIEVDPSTPMMISIAYPKGTTFELVAHAGWCDEDTTEYSCTHKFHQVDSVEEVRSSIGNTYNVDAQGVLTVRIIQTPKTFVGRPEFFLPNYSSVDRDGKGYAVSRFERNGIRLPKYTRKNYLSLETSCDSTDGVYCSEFPPPYEPIVCSPGFKQTGYDICTKELATTYLPKPPMNDLSISSSFSSSSGSSAIFDLSVSVLLLIFLCF